MFRYWGVGDIVRDIESFDGTTIYNTIEALGPYDKNLHTDIRRMSRNLFENQNDLYNYLEAQALRSPVRQGIYKGSLTHEHTISDLTDFVALSSGGTYETTAITTVANTSNALSGSYFNLYDINGNQFFIWFNSDGTSFNPSLYYPEKTEITVNLSVDITELDGAYFNLHTTTTDYYIWYNLDGLSSDPTPAGTGIEITIATGDGVNTIAQKTATILDAYSGGTVFSSSSTNEVISVENLVAGATTDATVGTTNFSINITQNGINSVVSGATEIEVLIANNDTADQVATKIEQAVDVRSEFVASTNTNIVTISAVVFGNTSDASDGVRATGFTFNITDGSETYKYYGRLTSGIIYFNDHILVTQPQIFVAERQLEKIFNLATWLPDPEKVEILYDETNDKFQAKISKLNTQGVLVNYEFTNGGTYGNLTNGYNTGVELIHAIYTDSHFHQQMVASLNGNLERVLVEPTVELASGSNVVYLGFNGSDIFIQSGSSISSGVNLYQLDYSASGATLTVNTLTDLRTFYQSEHDHLTETFYNVPTDISSSDTGTEDYANIDYTKITNQDVLWLVLRNNPLNNTEAQNAFFKWSETNERFEFNYDATFNGISIANIAAAAGGGLPSAATYADIPTAVPSPTDGIICFVRNENVLYRYAASISNWVPVSDKNKQFARGVGTKTGNENDAGVPLRFSFTGLDWKTSGSNLIVLLNGVIQLQDTDATTYDYSIVDTNTILFNEGTDGGGTSFLSTDQISVMVIEGGDNFYSDKVYYIAGTASGDYTGSSNYIFPSPFPVIVGRMEIYRNGLIQRESDFRLNSIATSNTNTTDITDSTFPTLDASYVNNFVLCISGSNAGEVRQIASVNDGTHTITVGTGFSNSIQIGDEFEIYTDYDYFSNYLVDDIVFNHLITINNGDSIRIDQGVSVVANTDIDIAGISFPTTGTIFGMEFYRTDLDAWYKFNGSTWIQIS